MRAAVPATGEGSPSGTHAVATAKPALERELLPVKRVEELGPYTLLRLERGEVDPGAPGQFYMLEAPDRILFRNNLG